MVISKEDLSSNAEIIISCIPEGEEWLNDTISSNHLMLSFKNEIDLVKSILKGLHAVELLFISKLDLFVHPTRLFQIPINELNVINQNAEESKVVAFLDKHGLLSTKKFRKNNEFLEMYGLEKHALFQVLNLDEKTNLYNFVASQETIDDDTKRLNEDASQYALMKAQTVSEFISHYRFYQKTIVQQELKDSSTENRYKQVCDYYKALVPIALTKLNCPQLVVPLKEEELFNITKNWIQQGSYIGFADLALAVYQLSYAIQVTDLDKDSLNESVNHYFNEMQVLLESMPVQTQTLSQSGRNWSYFVESTKAHAVMVLNELGELTLQSYKPNQSLRIENNSN
ncbi:hypothetical protein [Zooshikella sp. RANM57]|uniref:hypothetical protein n=1 Tax=Zooshikella sp. RANM57 TaxID=3425863 RepID=UPI003D6E7020